MSLPSDRSNPLAAFKPRVVDGRLVLTLRLVPQFVVILGVSGAGLVVATLLQLLLTPASTEGLAIAVVALAAAAVFYLADWGGTMHLEVRRDTLHLGEIHYEREHIEGFSMEGRRLVLWGAGKVVRSLEGLRQDPADLARLVEVLRAWADNPDFDPKRPTETAARAPHLGDRLALLEPSLDPDGYRIALGWGLDVRRYGLAWGPVPTLLVFLDFWNGLFTLVLLTLILLLAEGRWRPTRHVLLSPTGLAVEKRWMVPWSQICSATVDTRGQVQVNLVQGTTHTLRLRRPAGAAALAEVITERAHPDGGESDVPPELHHARRVQQGQPT